MKHPVWAICLKNAICMACWAALAIYFGRWWIALFSVLTMTSWERNTNDAKTSEESNE